MGRSKITAHDEPRPTAESWETAPEIDARPAPGRDIRKILPGVVISLLALAVVFYLADPRKLAESLRSADYLLVGLAILVSLLWLVVRAVVWRTLLQEKATLSQTFFSINEGYLLNNILPFRLGEVGRAYLLGRKANLGFWQVFSTVLIERALDLAFAAGLLLSTIPFVVGVSWAREAAIVAGTAVTTGLVVLHLLARNRDWAMAQFNRLAGRWPALARFSGERLEAFFNGLAVLTSAPRFLAAIGWMLIDWVIAIAEYYILMLAFFPEARLLWATFSLGVVALGVAAPSSPGSIGVMEASLVGALALFGLDISTATALALTAHLINYLLTGALGAYALARDGESLMGVFRRVRGMAHSDGS